MTAPLTCQLLFSIKCMYVVKTKLVLPLAVCESRTTLKYTFKACYVECVAEF